MIIFLCIVCMILCAACAGIHMANVNLGKELEEAYRKLNLETSESSAKVANLFSELENIRKERQQFIVGVQDSAEKQYQKYKEEELLVLRENERKNATDEANNKLESWIKENEKEIREDNTKRSKSVVSGKVTEQILPYFPDFIWNPRDARFLGSPIDLVIFHGMDSGEIEKVIFVEIKSGKSSLTSRERKLRDAILDKRVEWVELRNNYEEEK